MDDFEEIARMSEAELEAREDDPKVQAFTAYSQAVGALLFQAISFDLSKIMLVIPSSEKDYNEYSVLYGQIRENDSDNAEILVIGDVGKVKSAEENRILKKIWTGEIESDYVVDYQDKYNSISKGQTAPAWVMINDEKHFMFTVSWKTIPALASFVLGPKDMAKNMIKRYGEAAEGAGYTFGEIRKIMIGGIKAYGFPFSYDADDISMCGDSIVVKKGKAFYFFHTYYRETMKEECEPILAEIYDSISFEG